MDMFRVTARWAGFSGAPGYSNFFFATGGGLISDAQQVADRVRSAFGQLPPSLPQGTTVTIQPEVAVIDSDTGELTRYETITPGTTVSGTATGAYSGASGAVINWRTNDVRFGRRIRGRTFIVPLGSGAYDSTGTLSSGTLEDLNDFASVLVGGDLDSELGVWSRPRDGGGGVFATVVSATVPDMAAVLRSRRD